MVRSLRLLLSGLLLASPVALSQEADALSPARPIPIKKGCAFGVDYGKTETAWAERKLLKPAMEQWKGQPWAAQAEAFCREALKAEFSWEWRHGISIGDLADEARKLTTTRCDDALAYYLIHRAIYENTGDWRQAEHALDVALAVADYRKETPAALSCLIMNARRTVAEVRGSELFPWEKALGDAMVLAAGDGSYDAAAASVAIREQRRQLEDLKHYDGAFMERLEKAVQASSLPEWARLAVQGNIQVQWAWMERGGGWADQVKREGWKGFSEHLQQARKHLEKSYSLRPDRPEAAALMISVSMGECATLLETRAWFDRSVAAEFDYQLAYDSLMWAFWPRWGGSHELMLQFGAACADTKRFDTWIPQFAWAACNQVGDDGEDRSAIYRDPAMRASVTAAVEGFLGSRALSPGRRHKMLSRAAVATWLGHDEKLTARVLKEDGPKLEKWTLRQLLTMGHHEQELRIHVKAATGDYGPEIAHLEAAHTANDRARYQKLLDAMDVAKLPSEARAFVEQERDAAHFSERLDAGGWVPVTFRPGLTRCVMTGGHWEADGTGGVIASGTDEMYAELLLGSPATADMELRGEVTFDIPESLVQDSYSAGPVLGWVPQTIAGGVQFPVRGLLMHGSPGKEGVEIMGKNQETASPTITVALAPQNSFYLKRSEGAVSLEVNGSQVLQHISITSLGSGTEPGHAGLTVTRLPCGGKAHFTKVEVRHKPGPVTAAAADIRSAAIPATTPKLAPLLKRSTTSIDLRTWAFASLGLIGLLVVVLGKTEREV